MIGSVLGNRYELIEKIGEGGMSEVYKAKCKLLNRYVAVKVLKREYSRDSAFVDKFKMEATAAAALTCNNIVGIYDVGSQDGIDYIVMELVTGVTLKELIRKKIRLSLDETLDMGIQIAKALECAHKNGIIHRDIKPQNILVTEDGTVKVTDFGIAKAINSATITNTTKVIGSAHYFSPEQAKGTVIDKRTDIYSLGIVLYEMLTGKVPYEADSPVAVALKHIQEPAVPPIELNPTVSKSMNDLILKAMEKEPLKRYQSMSEMLQSMKSINLNKNVNIKMDEDDENDFTRVMAPITEQQILQSRLNNAQRDNSKIDHDNSEYDDEDEEYDDENEVDDYEGNDVKRKRFIKGGAIAAAFLVVAILCTFMIKFLSSSGNKEIFVPTIIGLDKEEAKKKVEEVGLKFVIESEEESIKPKDTVLSSTPVEGEKVKKDTEVKVIISKGNGKEISLKDFTEIKFSEVLDMLKAEGLELGNKEEKYDSNVPSGCVISQNPEPGSKVSKGDKIDFIISKGNSEKQVKVPDITGKTLVEAEILLNNVGLKLGSSKAVLTPNKELNGKVISQSIEKNSETKKGSSVNVTYYKFDEGLEFKK